MLNDLRLAIRLLVKERGFSLAALLALALTIGVSTTVFTIVNAMTRGLPVPDADRLMGIREYDAAGRQMGVSFPDFDDWRRAVKGFSRLAVFSPTTMSVIDDGHAPDRVQAAYVSSETFDLLVVQPILGRTFRPDEDRSDSQSVVILAGGLWKERYGSDPHIIGHTIKVNDIPSVVVGVMPIGFEFPLVSRMWQPLAQMPGIAQQPRNARTLQAVGRLADGTTMRQAASELSSVARSLQREHPDTNRGIDTTVMPYPGPFAPAPFLWGLTGAVVLLLTIACVNLANLLLARGARRAHELWVRAALGGSRWRILRQLLVESVVLSVASGVIGLLLAVLGLEVFSRAVAGIRFPYWLQWNMDRRVFIALTAVCVGAGLAFGIAPALRMSSTDLLGGLHQGGRSVVRVRSRAWSGTLLAAELALTVVLLVGAALMLHSFMAVYRADRVVDTTHVLTLRLTLGSKYSTPVQRNLFYQRAEERLARTPGVVAATVASGPPFAGAPLRQLIIFGAGERSEGTPPVSMVTIGPRYFDTLRLSLLRGRTLTGRDAESGQESAIVNQRLADMFFGGRDPIGQRVRIVNSVAPVGQPRWMTIVGVSPTVRQQFFEDLDPVIYVANGLDSPRVVSLMVRGEHPGSALVSLVRSDIHDLDPDLALYNIVPLEDLMTQSRWGHRILGSLFSVFAVIALLLCSVGLSATIAYSVVQRRQEIAVRMALGAREVQVIRLFVQQGLLPLVLGTVVGVAAALRAGRLLQQYLVQTSPTDPANYVTICLLLLAVGVIASIVPAWHAARINPVVALRGE